MEQKLFVRSPVNQIILDGFESINIPSGTPTCFVNKLPWLKKCAVCRHASIVVFQLSCHKRHALCRRCLKYKLQKEDALLCPLTDAETQVVTKIRNSRKRLQEEAVVCYYFRHGCARMTLLKNTFEHMRECKVYLKMQSANPEAEVHTSDAGASEQEQAPSKPGICTDSANIIEDSNGKQLSQLEDVSEDEIEEILVEKLSKCLDKGIRILDEIP